MEYRVRKLREELAQNDIENFLITDSLNVRYLSGFKGTFAVLLVTQDDLFLLTDFRYAQHVQEECPGVALELVESSWIPGLQKIAERLCIRSLGFESHSLNYDEWEAISGSLPFSRLVPVSDDPVGCLRMVKDDFEIQAIREAVRIIDLTYEHVSGMLKPGITEHDIRTEIECSMRRLGAEKEGFDTIVASGARAALPHAHPGDQQISDYDFILMDFGAVWDGYHSDITRTNILGAPDARQEEIYNIVLEAQSKAIEAIRPGIPGRDIDLIARNHIKKRGYGEYFGHSLGHGLGLAIHDARILASNSSVILEPNMVVTVEPGVYIPGWGGVRIEDDVLVTETGVEVLTKSHKRLQLS